MNTSHPCSDHFGEGATPMDLPISTGQKAEWKVLATRRHFLATSGQFMGALGLASLLPSLARAESLGSSVQHGVAPGVGQGSLGAPHNPGTAKRVIQLFMAGGPPHMDTWDCKPTLAQWNGKDMPASALGADFKPTGMTSGQSRYAVLSSPWGSKQYGQCGRRVSDLMPHMAKSVDDIALVRTMWTDAINHEPAILLMNTAAMFPGRPALGSWVSYGLGSANANLPSFIVLNSNTLPNTNVQSVTPKLWSSGFLPTEHAGVPLRTGADPVLYLNDPKGMTRSMRRAVVDGVSTLNRQSFEAVGDPETHARIAQYEMAFNMQMSVPDLTDLSKEPESTWELYGKDAKIPGTFAYNCLMARRMAERGVRYTQIYQRGWDVHGGLADAIPRLCAATDRPAHALITDLKRRGLLDDTLVIWGGEFGRTTYSQGGGGRDHHAKCFSMWFAGGGVKGGVSFGETDDFAFNAADPAQKVHVRDMIATVTHCLGIEVDRLSKRIQGVDLKPTGVLPSRVVKEILA